MLSKNYNPQDLEPRWITAWQGEHTYHFDQPGSGEVYSIDTPPPTVSGNLHLGHVYSYSHADFIARFRRMQGFRVYYPMGYDDNGLPTERLVEKRLGIKSTDIGRAAFIERCLQISEQAEQDYHALWQRLGISVDWRYTYRTIDARSRQISQWSFLDLYRKGLAYRRETPAIWCAECGTSIAQAELNDLERQSEFITLPFSLQDGQVLPVATTRPELLPACVAVFVHPDDDRYRRQVGETVIVPYFNQLVPVLADPGADPKKGTGAVMCCTFGDSTDVAWWFTYHLPLVEAIGRDGRMTKVAGEFSGLEVNRARQEIATALNNQGLVLGRMRTAQTVRIHERCDTPIEFVVAPQWFIRLLDHKEDLLRAGELIKWRPEYMQARYRAWVENLNWDWCISRQRYFGVTFPVWFCQDCGEVIVAEERQLPVDPSVDLPAAPCACGSTSFLPETDVMDTWATSSMTPQIVGQWQPGEVQNSVYPQVFPFGLRPQAHEIIRTWAFYTIVKSLYHFNQIPWKSVLISGWGIAGDGMGKISKSRGGGPLPPLEMIERYSADAVRYWAASSGPGKDAVISEEKIQLGSKLMTKLWNVARFSERFFNGFNANLYNTGSASMAIKSSMTPADRWIMARLQALVQRSSELFESGEYAAAKSETESFLWRDLADNYLEMSKQRLYDPAHPQFEAGRFVLYHVLLTLYKLFAPFFPFVTEEIYQVVFARFDGAASIHRSSWPVVDGVFDDTPAIETGEYLVDIATAARRFKSEHSMPLGHEIGLLQIACSDPDLAAALQQAAPDLMSIIRAKKIEIKPGIDQSLETIYQDNELAVAIGLP